MTRNKLVVLVLGLCGAGALMAYPVFAHCGKCLDSGKAIVQKMQGGKVTLAKAVEAAEAHSKGKAVSVTSSLDSGNNLNMQVFCIAGDKIQRCDVNGTTGVVAKSEAVDHFPIAKEDDHDHPHDDDTRKGAPGAGGAGGAGAGGAGGAGGGTAMNIVNREIELACAGCVYHMSGAKGCQLAAKVDGKNYMLKGNHGLDAHEFCSSAKKAVVTGRIEGDNLVATDVEIKS